MAQGIICPSCQRLIVVNDSHGPTVQCPHCNQVVAVSAAPAPGAAIPVVSYAQAGGPPASSGLAIAAMVCGILGVIGCWPVGVAGLIMGVVALVRSNRQPARYGGKGMAIAGICTGALSFVILPMFLAIMLPALSRARELSKRTVCSANMRGIGVALSTYLQNGGRAPMSTSELQSALISAGFATPKQFLCPSDTTNATCSYHYVVVSGTNLKQPLLYEDPAVHGNEGGNILFLDGHTEFVKAPQHQQIVKAIAPPMQSNRPPDGP